MSIKLQLPKLTDLAPRLTVIGVGGAGCNAVNNMIAAGLTGVEFVVANTDAQSLAASSAEHRIQLGMNLTEGLGAGSKPEIGEAAAEEAIEDIRAQVSGSHMVFIAAGMGGGTGTGAASVIARVAREQGILTVGVVTKPFQFEGARRMRIADAGICELRKHVDTLIVIPNQNLFRIANEKTTFAEAFVLADQVLYSGVACIVDLIIKEGLINLDFADVRTVMSGMGTAMMGTGEASGDRRAILAAEEAISNPLLDDVTLKGARGLLLSITGGRDLTLYEVDEAASRVRQEVDSEANIIVGATFDDSLGDRVRVSIVASGMARAGEPVSVPGTTLRTTAATPAHAPAQAPPAPQSQHIAAPPVPATGAPVASSPIPSELKAAAPVVAAPVLGAPEFGARAASGNQAPFDGTGYPGVPSAQPAMAAQAAHAAVPRDGYDPAAYAAQSARETWRAPGNVVIEETLPAFGGTAQPMAPAPAAEPASNPSQGEFTPAAPQEIRRPAARRMPEVEDFPIVGQRDYRAKTDTRGAGYGDVPPPLPASQSAEPRRKPGFFERLTGRASRHEEDSNHTQQVAPGKAGQPRSGVAPQTGDRGHSTAAHGSDRGPHQPTRRDGQPAELPVFFSRERK